MRFRGFLKAVWLGQCITATYFSITNFYIGYLTTPRGQIPFYCDFIAGILGIGLFFDWLIGLFA